MPEDTARRTVPRDKEGPIARELRLSRERAAIQYVRSMREHGRSLEKDVSEAYQAWAEKFLEREAWLNERLSDSGQPRVEFWTEEDLEARIAEFLSSSVGESFIAPQVANNRSEREKEVLEAADAVGTVDLPARVAAAAVASNEVTERGPRIGKPYITLLQAAANDAQGRAWHTRQAAMDRHSRVFYDETSPVSDIINAYIEAMRAHYEWIGRYSLTVIELMTATNEIEMPEEDFSDEFSGSDTFESARRQAEQLAHHVVTFLESASRATDNLARTTLLVQVIKMCFQVQAWIGRANDLFDTEMSRATNETQSLDPALISRVVEIQESSRRSDPRVVDRIRSKLRVIWLWVRVTTSHTFNFYVRYKDVGGFARLVLILLAALIAAFAGYRVGIFETLIEMLPK